MIQLNLWTPPPAFPPQKEPFTFFGPKWCAMFWNVWIINFPIFSYFVHIFQGLLQTKIEKKSYLKRCAYSQTDFCVHKFFWPIFSLWDMVNFVFKQWLTVNWGLSKNPEEIFANLMQTLTSENIFKSTRDSGEQPWGGGAGGQSTHKIGVLNALRR